MRLGREGLVWILATAAAAFGAATGCVAERSDAPAIHGWRDLPLVPFDPAHEAHAPTASSPGAMDRDQLARALRMVVLRPDGSVGVTPEPNWRAADDALGGTGATIERSPTVLPPRDDAAPEGETTVARVFSPDGRLAPASTMIAPYNAIVRITSYSDYRGGGYMHQCTGSYVGPWTVLLSASCLRMDDGNVAKRLVFEPAIQSANAPPFGPFDCRNGDAPWDNDFAAAMPVEYATSKNPAFDFAVIDTYPCHAAPRWFPGYVVNAPDGTFSMFGYPMVGCPGSGNLQCGMSGFASVYGWWLESVNIDSDVGQEGAPWYQSFTQKVAGTDVGYVEYHDFGRCGFDACRRNIARRIDGTYDSFIQMFSYDF